MKLTVLVDNNTLIDRYYIGEPGVSYYIEDDDIKILFDAGYSDIFIQNAQKMNISLLDLDCVVLSHGHIDHTWGLLPLVRMFTEAKTEKRTYKELKLFAHPEAFAYKVFNENEEIGSVLTKEKLSKHFIMSLSQEPIWLSEKFVFLGEIERSNDFENKMPVGHYEKDGDLFDDFIVDDTALVYKSDMGLVIITGCSHAGICNIVEYAKKVCNDDRILDIIGGFHLQDPDENTLKNTVSYFENTNIKTIHPCHCTDLRSKIDLSKALKVEEVGVGLILEYESL